VRLKSSDPPAAGQTSGGAGCKMRTRRRFSARLPLRAGRLRARRGLTDPERGPESLSLLRGEAPPPADRKDFSANAGRKENGRPRRTSDARQMLFLRRLLGQSGPPHRGPAPLPRLGGKNRCVSSRLTRPRQARRPAEPVVK